MSSTVSTAGASRVYVPPTARWRLTPRSGLAVLGAEVRKGLTTQLAHPIAHLVMVAFTATVYLGLQYVMGQGQIQRDLVPQTLIGISGYWLLQFASMVMVADLVSEKRGGTFAAAQMAPAPMWLVMGGRLITASIMGVVVAVVATLVPMLVMGVTIPLRWAALVPYALVLVNVLAFTFMLAAFALSSPMIGVLQTMLTSMVILMNGAVLPLSFFPDWLAVVARLLPTTIGVEATTKVLFQDKSLSDIWSDGTLPWLIAYTAALALLGWWIFVRNHRKALAEGRLGQY
ncbi:ABC transporter permease [Streptosporangium sp. NPDC048865]|uniref:ABC transporter permease n=1 Tax=Streptosporangium sp. NPDC048865 TaxID=3155766 RepID=UPI00342ED5E0